MVLYVDDLVMTGNLEEKILQTKHMLSGEFDMTKSTFLKGDLKEEVYVEHPLGFVLLGLEGKVCKLKKALYGFEIVPMCMVPMD